MNKDSINANIIANKEWNKTYDNLWDVVLEMILYI